VRLADAEDQQPEPQPKSGGFSASREPASTIFAYLPAHAVIVVACEPMMTGQAPGAGTCTSVRWPRCGYRVAWRGEAGIGPSRAVWRDIDRMFGPDAANAARARSSPCGPVSCLSRYLVKHASARVWGEALPGEPGGPDGRWVQAGDLAALPAVEGRWGQPGRFWARVYS
jgi:hypothetical protein